MAFLLGVLHTDNYMHDSLQDIPKIHIVYCFLLPLYPIHARLVLFPYLSPAAITSTPPLFVQMFDLLLQVRYFLSEIGSDVPALLTVHNTVITARVSFVPNTLITQVLITALALCNTTRQTMPYLCAAHITVLTRLDNISLNSYFLIHI